MTITAESFVGRILAVFSRRSPGFRPHPETIRLRSATVRRPARPLAPVPDSVGRRENRRVESTHDVLTALSLTDATACWKVAPPQERLQLRSQILDIAKFLTYDALTFEVDRANARASAADLAVDLARIRSRELKDIDLEFLHDLARARDLAHDLARARLRHFADVRDLARVRDLALARVRDLTLDRALIRVRERVLDLHRHFHLDGDLDFVLHMYRDPDFGRDLYRACDLDLDRVRSLDRAVALLLVLDRERERERQRAGELDPVHALEIVEARSNLVDAADNFIGADLSNVNLDVLNLVGVRWGNSTRWPTPEFKADVQKASEEDPPGSGVFIVRPDWHHNFADHSSPIPTSF